jgi:hypothetical protein
MYVPHLKYKMKECAPNQGGTDGVDHVEDWVVAAWGEQPGEIGKKECR